jgi:hypothetical protein
MVSALPFWVQEKEALKEYRVHAARCAGSPTVRLCSSTVGWLRQCPGKAASSLYVPSPPAFFRSGVSRLAGFRPSILPVFVTTEGIAR